MLPNISVVDERTSFSDFEQRLQSVFPPKENRADDAVHLIVRTAVKIENVSIVSVVR